MFQLSLRTLLILVALVALAIVSLRNATLEWRMVIISIAAGLLCGAIVLAFAGRGRRRVFAGGFIFTMLLYALLILASMSVGGGLNDTKELNPDTGRLPTTWLLRPIFHALSKIDWIDLRTGQAANQSTVSIESDPNSAHYSLSETPSREVFMTIGHLWWSIFFGICGGVLAEWLFLRRQRQPLATGRP